MRTSAYESKGHSNRGSAVSPGFDPLATQRKDADGLFPSKRDRPPTSLPLANFSFHAFYGLSRRWFTETRKRTWSLDVSVASDPDRSLRSAFQLQERARARARASPFLRPFRSPATRRKKKFRRTSRARALRMRCRRFPVLPFMSERTFVHTINTTNNVRRCVNVAYDYIF